MAESNKEIVLEVLKKAFIDRDPTVVEQYFAANLRVVRGRGLDCQ